MSAKAVFSLSEYKRYYIRRHSEQHKRREKQAKYTRHFFRFIVHSRILSLYRKLARGYILAAKGGA